MSLSSGVIKGILGSLFDVLAGVFDGLSPKHQAAQAAAAKELDDLKRERAGLDSLIVQMKGQDDARLSRIAALESDLAAKTAAITEFQKQIGDEDDKLAEIDRAKAAVDRQPDNDAIRSDL